MNASDEYERRLPEDLEAVAGRLRSDRPRADALQLDQIKLRAISRANEHRRLTPMKSRIATIVTIMALACGTGGAIAVASSGSSSSSFGGASSGQYKPGKGCGDRNHHHTGSNGKNKPCPEPSGHHHH